MAEKLIFHNPADSCHLPPARAREMQVLTPEEIQRLLIQAKEGQVALNSFSWNSPQGYAGVKSAPSNRTI